MCCRSISTSGDPPSPSPTAWAAPFPPEGQTRYTCARDVDGALAAGRCRAIGRASARMRAPTSAGRGCARVSHVHDGAGGLSADGCAPSARGRSRRAWCPYKAVAWRERDRTDIERLLVTHRDRIDLGRVRRVLSEFAEALGRFAGVSASSTRSSAGTCTIGGSASRSR